MLEACVYLHRSNYVSHANTHTPAAYYSVRKCVNVVARAIAQYTGRTCLAFCSVNVVASFRFSLHSLSFRNLVFGFLARILYIISLRSLVCESVLFSIQIEVSVFHSRCAALVRTQSCDIQMLSHMFLLFCLLAVDGSAAAKSV